LNTAVWGGIYNPIVVIPSDEAGGVLSAFDVDRVVNLTGKPLRDPLSVEFEHRTVEEADLLQRPDFHTRTRSLSLGFGMGAVLRYVAESELRDASWRSRVALIKDVPDEWRLYCAASFGGFAELPKYAGEVAASFKSLTGAQDVAFSTNDDAAYGEWVFPIFLTRHRLRRFGGVANFSSHLVYFGDHANITDLVEFWNIRATGRETWFVPINHVHNHLKMATRIIRAGKYAINPQVENSADIQKGASVSEERLQQIVATLPPEIGPFTVRTWRPRFGLKAEYYVGDIHAADIEGAAGEEISFLTGDRMTPIKLVEPPYLDESYRFDDHMWAVELQLSNPYSSDELMCRLPNAHGLSRLAREVIMGGLGEVRLGRNGIVLVVERQRSNAYLAPVKTFDVFKAMLEEATGLKAFPSQAGIYADRIIHKMGRLDYDCRIFKVRGVREIIGRLSAGDTLTRGNMCDIVKATTPDRFGQNWDPAIYEHIYRQRNGSPHFSAIFSEMLDKRVIRPGMFFECNNCHADTWYHVSEFAEDYTCRFCFERQRVNFASKTEWNYKADGLFQVADSAQGSIAAILALWRLNEVSHHLDDRFCTGIELRRPDNNVAAEVDFCFLKLFLLTAEYELVIGEAKGFEDYDADKLHRLLELADGLSPQPYVATATLKDRYSEGEQELLRDIVKRGYKLIPLTRLELDPYYTATRFAQMRNPHAVSLRDLSDNCVFLNIHQRGANPPI